MEGDFRKEKEQTPFSGIHFRLRTFNWEAVRRRTILLRSKFGTKKLVEKFFRK
jgi:hypothetical protein